MKKIYNFTNIASHYRSLLWSKLLNSQEFDFHFLFGTNTSLNIETIDFDRESFESQKQKLHSLKNRWIRGKYLIWQSGAIVRCLVDKMNIAIFLGEFQILSTWVCVLICKVRRIKVVFWTHGLYGNESTLIRKLRILFYKTADQLLVYERRPAKLLMQEGIDSSKIKVIFNSLDYDLHKKLREKLDSNSRRLSTCFGNPELPYLIFVGRLTRIKNIELVIKAIHKIGPENKLNLLILGDGNHKKELLNLVQELDVENHVYFYGACYDEEILAELIYNAVLCVSPGNVGLTAIHALSYGTPVCTHNNFHNQMPEVEAVTDGFTGCFFKENDLDSLIAAILHWCIKNTNKMEIRKRCYKVIDELYNPYNQLKVIKSLTEC